MNPNPTNPMNNESSKLCNNSKCNGIGIMLQRIDAAKLKQKREIPYKCIQCKK